jgi:hypothetical protein
LPASWQFIGLREGAVTIVETGSQLAPEMPLPMKWRVEAEMAEHHVTVFTEAKPLQIGPAGMEIMTREGEKQSIPAHNIIIEAWQSPGNQLADKFQGLVNEIYLAGDCSKSSFIKDSVTDGTKIGSTGFSITLFFNDQLWPFGCGDKINTVDIPHL